MAGAKCQHHSARTVQCVCDFDCGTREEEQEQQENDALQHKHAHQSRKRGAVCGSDNIVYFSTCLLKKSACLSQTHITVAREGAC
jgi:hypothetical protein